MSVRMYRDAAGKSTSPSGIVWIRRHNAPVSDTGPPHPVAATAAGKRRSSASSARTSAAVDASRRCSTHAADK